MVLDWWILVLNFISRYCCDSYLSACCFRQNRRNISTSDLFHPSFLTSSRVRPVSPSAWFAPAAGRLYYYTTFVWTETSPWRIWEESLTSFAHWLTGDYIMTFFFRMADPPSGPQAVADQSSAKKKQVGGCAKIVYIHFVYTHSFFTWLPYFCSPFINLTPVLLATIPTNANHWSFSIFCTECIAEGCEKRWALRWAAVPNSWSCHQVLHSSEQLWSIQTNESRHMFNKSGGRRTTKSSTAKLYYCLR